MNMALKLAELGRGYTSPNPLVGAVVVKDGNVVGSGYHRAAGGPHAEICAIEEAGLKARGATLYVTLEPCNHVGRTPPCTEAILRSGIKRVVIGTRDPNPDVKGGGVEFLREHGIEVITGILEKDVKRQNEFFIKYVTTKQPFVILKSALTLDGSIATSTGDSKWISNSASREFVHRLRHAVDAVMVGIGTIRRDDPRLTTRLKDVDSSDPIRIILDTRLTISPDSKVLNLDSDSDTIIVTGSNIDRERLKRLKRPGIDFMTAAVKDGLIELSPLMSILGKRGITSLLIEGGSRVNGSAISAGIVDKIILFYAPRILGGNDGFPLFTGKGVLNIRDTIRVSDIRVHQFEDDLMIEGYLKGGHQQA